MQDLIGKQFDQYRIDALLGQGAVGTVYRAYDVNLARVVALKVAYPHLAAQPRFQERFIALARAAERLKHPSVAAVYDFGAFGERRYMVTAYEGDGSLGLYLNQLQAGGWSVDLRETLELLAQAADGLAYAHRQGMVHQDVRPENILLARVEPEPEIVATGIRAIVTDFGLAELLEGVTGPSNGALRALGYMSPEQCLGTAVDGRSDIYSLGVLLYQLTTGRLPFTIHSRTAAVVKHLKELPPPASAVNPDLPAKIDAIIRKALAKEREARFADATHLAHALRAAAAELTADDLARFAQPAAIHGVRAAIDSRTAAAATGGAPQPQPRAPSVFEVTVTRPDVAAQTLPLRGLTLIAGRAAECDLVLDASGVSRHHVRLERTVDGWQVVDLGSTNGTFIEKNRLLAGMTERWDREHALRIGPFSLHWHKNQEQEPALTNDVGSESD